MDHKTKSKIREQERGNTDRSMTENTIAKGNCKGYGNGAQPGKTKSKQLSLASNRCQMN